MKKFLSIILALALVMSLSILAFAANETSGQTDLTFTYGNAPAYTVTIPGSLTLSLGNNFLPITVSDTADLAGKTVTVTFEGTQKSQGSYYHARLYPNGDLDYFDPVTYYLYDANDYRINLAAAIDAGILLAEFSGNGTKSIMIRIEGDQIDPVWHPGFQPGVPYTGYITFGIKLV